MGVLTSERRAVARSVAAVQAINSAPTALVADELERPFAERVIAPLGGRLVGIGRKITRADTAEKIAHRLDIAGNPPAWDVNRIIGLKVLGLGAIGGLGFLFCLSQGYSLNRIAIFTAGFAALGYMLPNLLLKNAGDKRESLMRNALPDAIDLLTISVEAGLGFDAAVARVAKNTSGPLAQEFSRLLQEMQLGIGRSEAMRAMGERTSLPDLKSFCLAMVQADSLGIPIARVLRIQSHEMRTKRRQRAEEAAQKVPVKILFPVIFFILPTIFIVVIGPVFLSMGDLFGGQ
jgi:tight adherence protein C